MTHKWLIKPKTYNRKFSNRKKNRKRNKKEINREGIMRVEEEISFSLVLNNFVTKIHYMT